MAADRTICDMPDVYDQIFYVLYCWDGFVNGGRFQRARPFDAVVMMSALNFLNLLAVMFMVGTAIRYDLMGFGDALKLCAVLVMLVIFACNYLYFVKSDRYKRILARYENLPASEIKSKVAVTVVYVLFSFLAFFVPVFTFM